MFTSSGILHFDPLPASKHFDPWWALLLCDEGIAEHYAWHLKRHGIEVNPKGLWGTHISVLKGEVPIIQEKWATLEGVEIEFTYNHHIRYENGKHAWIDVYSEDLSAIREMYGFPFKPWYHLTVGRLVRPYATS